VRPAARAAPVVIRSQRRKLRRSLIWTALVSLGGLASAIAAQPLGVRITGALLFVGTGALVAFGVRRMRSREPLLVVTDDGLRLRSFGFLPWDDIEALTISGGTYAAKLEIDLVGRRPLVVFEDALPFSVELLRDLIEQRAGRTWPH
jgi:hypothetical protein